MIEKISLYLLFISLLSSSLSSHLYIRFFFFLIFFFVTFKIESIRLSRSMMHSKLWVCVCALRCLEVTMWLVLKSYFFSPLISFVSPGEIFWNILVVVVMVVCVCECVCESLLDYFRIFFHLFKFWLSRNTNTLMAMMMNRFGNINK